MLPSPITRRAGGLAGHAGVLLLLGVLGAGAAGCGGGDSGGTAPPVQAAVASVSIANGDTLYPIGAHQQLAAILRDSAGTVLNGRTVTWSGGDTTVSLQSNGLLRCLHLGTTTVYATSEGVVGSLTFRVMVGPVATVQVSPSAITLDAGDSVQLTATFRDSAGNLVSGIVPAWSSGDTTLTGAPTTLRVSPTGLVTTIRVTTGPRSVMATGGGKVGATAITIGPGALSGNMLVYNYPLGTFVGTGDLYTFDAAADLITDPSPPMIQLTTNSWSVHEGGAIWSPDYSQIAFHGYHPGAPSGYAYIYVVPTSGGTPQPVSTLFSDGGRPRWSPDGSRLTGLFRPDPILGQESELWAMNADASGATAIVDSLARSEGEWLNGGNTIAFLDTLYRVNLVSATGGVPTLVNLTVPAGGTLTQFKFSPDGTRVGYTSVFNNTQELWVANSDGTAPVRVLDDFYGGWQWSPDGNRLAAFRDSPLPGFGSNDLLMLVDADGGNLVEATLQPWGAWFFRVSSALSDLAWSPDGQRVAFSGCLVRSTVTVRGDTDACGVYSVRRDGTGPIGHSYRIGVSVQGWRP